MPNMMASTTRRTASHRCVGALSAKILAETKASPLSVVSLATISTSTTTPTTPTLACIRSSGIGTDVEMIATNDRLRSSASFSTAATTASTASTISSSTAAAVPTTSTSEMKDEYGAMDDAGHTYVHPGDFVLENGSVLTHAQLRYQTYGKLNETRDNVLVVCHALTGNATLHAWWGDLLGPQQPFDTEKYFVVCCNILGSCYGSTGPRSMNPNTHQPYGKDFPDISVQDTVNLQLLLLQHGLNIRSVQCVIGGSFGGMQAVEFAVQAGSAASSQQHFQRGRGSFVDDQGLPYVRSVIPIACGAQHTAWQIAISEVQRQAIYKDPAWNSSDPTKATAGLEIARQLGMISYRTPMGYVSKFGRSVKDADDPAAAKYGSEAAWQVKSYLEYQGHKFLDRFDPVTYVKMTEQMDSHDVARGRGESIADVLGQVVIPTLVLGIDSDVLYPLSEQQELARLIPGAELCVIHSEDGHDGFLLEQEQVGAHISDFLNRRHGDSDTAAATASSRL